jgi:hypothetical protein
MRTCTRSWFIEHATLFAADLDTARVVLRETTIFEDRATVRATVDTGRTEPRLFNPGSYTFDATYTLVREGDRWLLQDTGWPYGSCDFIRPTITPEAPPPTAAPAG